MHTFSTINLKAMLSFIILLMFSLLPLKAQQRALPADTAVVSTHEVTINGKKVPYRVTVGTLPVFGKDGKPDAALQYTFYERLNVKDKDSRPLLVSFNGGPGAASLWMHLGFTSPKRLKISDEGFPVQPYGVVDNPYSILDATDIVYVNPVNTGFSRMLNDGKPEQFFGVQEDLRYLSDWITQFVSRYQRWYSPKFLIGESYGTTRVAGLAGRLQGGHNLFINGVILHSQCGMGQPGTATGDRTPISNTLKLTHYTATAWYFKQLTPALQNQKLENILPEVEQFIMQEYIPAINMGGALSDSKRQEIAKKVARYSGVSEQFVLANNLSIPSSAFWKELLRDQGLTTGRLDSRYTGMDSNDAGTRPGYSPEYDSWKHSFTPAINGYLRDDLGFKTNLEYNVSGNVYPWNNDNGITAGLLRRAMEQNPSLRVLNQAGYYDGACEPFGAKYALWQMDAAGRLQDRIEYKEYQSGHMIYIRKDMLKEANNDVRNFILNAIPKKGEPIKYEVETVDLSNYDK
jgi:carboxypeptidase C (cathepsin A)